MNTPSNANTSGLIAEIDAEMEGRGRGYADVRGELLFRCRDALVTAASAQARIDAAEARADRLAKALEAARGTLDAIDCLLTTDRTVAGAAKHAVKRIDEALQQETQP